MFEGKLRTLSVAAFVGLIAAGSAQSDEIGQGDFETYCANCHGMSGEGDGPLTSILAIDVPDLTAIAARNDGEFPFLAIAHIVDGRSASRGHGSAMPVWGDYFMSEGSTAIGDYSAAIQARGRVLSLVYFLESIQD